ncbi:DEAD/DEAH box helicase [Dyadobacter psychrotolerans]|uniref:DEAD/DEAH box helicase n=1 Tax=Dyadobacter psychrotolerans TaxID=2541721 RepID=A0A4R5E1Q2_9BACT|nr:DEAD/DEAH box helicase [Dyadobacter psychrotolerans]TDE18711.1 DEAD/DEAH box helicase [Dyadobacter psychrotolerans]
MTFADLNLTKPLLSALTDLGYTTPTTIQEKVFSVMMSGKDVCGIAQTGTGKTFAYLLPTLRQLEFSKDRLPQLLIIVPTRELVVQVVEEVRKLAAYMTLQAVGVYGGGNIKVQMAELKQGADVVVATPGRLVDLALNGSLKTKAIKKLVIDEVDEMLNLGFRTQLKNILDLLPQRRQNLLFSATITQEVEVLMQTYFNSPVRIEAAPVGTPLENIEQTGYLVPNFYTKVNLLDKLLDENPEMSKVLIFVATKKLADQLFNQLELGYLNRIGVIHSNKEQNHRFNSVKQFHEGTYRILIATDIIARGLDVAEVSHVFNFDIPEIPENYIHRIGRTGRADRKGKAISFITERDQEYREAIEELMHYEIPVLTLPEDLKISDILTPDEEPKINMKNIDFKLPKRESTGSAFHEKIAKNQKVNVRRNHALEKMQKYGRPIKRSGKK